MTTPVVLGHVVDADPRALSHLCGRALESHTAAGAYREERGMSIYTRSGDSGTTSLADGTRVSKAEPAGRGVRHRRRGQQPDRPRARGESRRCCSTTSCTSVQQRLFNCSSSLAMPEEHRSEHTPVVTAKTCSCSKGRSTGSRRRPAPSISFVLEAGDEAACRLQVARAAARRAERRLVALARGRTRRLARSRRS